MTIQRLVEIFSQERQDNVIDAAKVLEYVNALETKLCTEVFLTHKDAPPGVYVFMGLPLPGHKPGDWPPLPPHHTPGYSDEWSYDDYKTIPLLVKPPYDDIYRAYIQWRIDLSHNDTIDAGNSQRVFWLAYSDFQKAWHRDHMPVKNTRIENKE